MFGYSHYRTPETFCNQCTCEYQSIISIQPTITMTPLVNQTQDDAVSNSDQRIPQRNHSESLCSSLPTVSKSESTTPIILHRSASVVEATTNAEHSMTLRQGVHQFPKAITWSVVISMTLVMEGYSTILVPNLFAMDPFRRQFGNRLPNGTYEISANWQSALVNGGLAGQILGLFATGTVAERIGYRHTLMLGLMAMNTFILVTFFATSKEVLLAGQCLLGMPWGMFQCISTVYAADVCPVALRAYLTTYVWAQFPLIQEENITNGLPDG